MWLQLDTIPVKCYFFDEHEIENDIDPGDIQSFDDHITLMNYMTDMSKSLGKPVIMTAESTPAEILITVDKDDVKLNLA